MVKVEHSSTILKAANIPEAVYFYKNIMGFDIDYISGDPPNYAVVKRDEVYLHISNQNTLPWLVNESCSFIVTKGVNQLYIRVEEAGVEILETLTIQNHGAGVIINEFVMKDMSGNVLRIGELLPHLKDDI